MVEMKKRVLILPDVSELNGYKREEVVSEASRQFDAWLRTVGAYSLGYEWGTSSVVFGPNIPTPVRKEGDGDAAQ